MNKKQLIKRIEELENISKATIEDRVNRLVFPDAKIPGCSWVDLYKDNFLTDDILVSLLINNENFTIDHVTFFKGEWYNITPIQCQFSNQVLDDFKDKIQESISGDFCVKKVYINFFYKILSFIKLGEDWRCRYYLKSDFDKALHKFREEVSDFKSSLSIFQHDYAIGNKIFTTKNVLDEWDILNAKANRLGYKGSIIEKENKK